MLQIQIYIYWFICLQTRNWGAQSHEGNGVDTILEVNEAAEMAGHVTDDSGTQTHRGDGYHEGGIAVGNAWLLNTKMLDKLRISNI